MLGERLRTARKAAGMTQKEAAAVISVTESTYCGYETGKRQPDAVKISALAKAFGVSGDFLLNTGLESTKKESPDAEATASRDSVESEFLKYLALLTDDQKKFLLAVFRTLHEQNQ